MDLAFLKLFVNTSKVAGWTRALVGAGFVALFADLPWLHQYITPETQQALAVAASGIAIGIWSHIAKTKAAS